MARFAARLCGRDAICSDHAALPREGQCYTVMGLSLCRTDHGRSAFCSDECGGDAQSTIAFGDIYPALGEPRVSPAKSWEGLVGGLVVSLIAGYVFYRIGWTAELGLSAYPVFDSMLLAFVCTVFGTLGDLMESLLKRTVGVKDSGKFMPGHGGVLDRFDSLLLATPVVYFLFIYMVNFVL